MKTFQSILLLVICFAVFPLTGAGAAEANDISGHFEKSFDSEYQGDNSSALKEVLKILRLDGGNYTATLRAGWLSYQLGSHEDAIEHYRKAVSLAPYAVEPRLGLLLPLMALKRWERAEAVAHEALRLDETNFTVNSRLAYIFFSRGKYGLAARHYKKVLKLYPSDVEMQLGLAWTYVRMGKKRAARRLFGEILQVRRSNSSAQEGMEAVRK